MSWLVQTGETRRIVWREVAGEPVLAHRLKVTPLSCALSVRLPGGAFVWHRPVALLVEGDGETTRLPIRDPSRRVQVALALSGLALLIAVWIRTTQ
jgi:hypothetical protein